MVEKMLDNLPKTKCIFPECSFRRADRQAVVDHQEDCMHRKAPCVCCGESMAMSSLNQHLTTQHGGKIHRMVVGAVWTLPLALKGALIQNLGLGTSQTMMLGAINTPMSDVVFYLNGMSLYGNNVMWWVSYNGPKKDRRKYQFSIKVLDLGDPKKVALSVTKYCVPCDVSSAVVKEQYLGFFINRELAQEVNVGADPNFPSFKANIEVSLT